MFLEFILLASIALFCFYKWATLSFDFYEKRGIPYDKPVPLFGSMMDVVLRRRSMFDIFLDFYNNSKGKVYGMFDQRNPVLIIKDRELIKHVTVKNFDHFVNHRTVFNDSDGNLFGNSLFSMQNAKWKDMRATLSPAFTGSKMRQMFQLMNEVAEESLMLMKKTTMDKPSGDGDHGVEVDIKNYFTLFTNDTIASTAFGLRVNSVRDPNNEFYVMGKRITTFTFWQNLKFFFYANFKFVMKLLKVELFDKKDTDYFMKLVLSAMKQRQEENIVRPDMINMLMEAKGLIKSDTVKVPTREWTDEEIVAQCFLFFFAGFETAAVLMSFAAHELMENPEIQDRLREEIDDVMQNLNGKPLTYEALQGMKYMDMIVSETLRKWPPAPMVDRLCNKSFHYKDEDGFEIDIKAGENLFIPIAGMHRDPKYFTDPSKFNPERFSDENKDDILPFTYMPFGMGPRSCIASRFVLLEAKAILFYLVREFKVEAAKKSTIPMKLSAKSGFQLAPENGFWLKLVARAA